MSEWALRPDGNLDIGPLLGWDTATAPMTGLLRLHYATTQEEFDAGGRAVQMALTTTQMREFAQALLRLADHVDNQPLGTAQ